MKKTRKGAFWLLLIAAGLMLATSGCVDTLNDYPSLFERNVTIVVGENATQIELDGANLIAYDLNELTGNEPLIKTDSEVTEETKHNNLILVGRAETNKVLNDTYWITNAARVTEEYPGAGKGILEVTKNPWNKNKAMLLVEGSDEWGVRAGSVVLEDKGQLAYKRKILVDWKEATGITFPINNSENAIKYSKMNAYVKKLIKQILAHDRYKIKASHQADTNCWIVLVHIDTPVPENTFGWYIFPDGTIRGGGFI